MAVAAISLSLAARAGLPVDTDPLTTVEPDVREFRMTFDMVTFKAVAIVVSSCWEVESDKKVA